MNKRNLLVSFAVSVAIFVSGNIFATNTQPKFTIIPTIPVANITTNIAQYRVTNQTKITRSLTMVTIPGVNQVLGGVNGCNTVFTLAQGQSCLLTLRATNSIYNTPVQICKTNYNNNNPDPFLCSQTSTANNLNLILPRVVPQARLIATPKELTLTVSGSAKAITVTNISPLYATTNVQADLTGTPLQGNVTQDASDCTSLPALGTCDLTFTPSNQAVSLTSFPIQGDNSTQAASSISIIEDNTALIKVTAGNPLILDEGGNGTLTLTNNSNVTATSVQADLSALQDPTALTQNASACSSLSANASCNIQFTANSVLAPEAMFIFGSNTSVAASGVAVNASTQVPLEITAGSPLLLKADGSTTGTMTIKNNSSTETAASVEASFTNTALSGNVTASSCGDIAPQASCTMTFTPGITTVVPTNFTIAGTNTSTVTGNLGINSYLVFITNQGPTGEAESYVRACTVSQSDGSFSNCSTLSNLSNLSTISGAAFNSAANHAYFISSIYPTVTDCDFDPSSLKLSNCNNTSLTSGGNIINGNGIVYNPNLNSIYATASGSSSSSSNSKVYYCTLNSSGKVTSCANTGADNLTYPTGISLNTSGTTAYISNYISSSAVVTCDIDSSNNFSNCTSNNLGNGNNGIAVNSTNTYVYVSEQLNNQIAQCPIDLSSCTNVNANTNNSTGLGLNNVSGYLYVGNGIDNQVQQCSINSSSGAVSGCSTNSGAGNLQFPIGVALFPTPP